METDRKTQIIKTAAKRFARHGLNKTTLEEIARDLRIGKATIYHYFASKDSLFYQTLEYDAFLYIEDIKQILNNEQVSFRERFAEYFNYKQGIDNRYKLLYDLMIKILNETGLEKEQDIFKDLLLKEEDVIKLILNSLYSNKIELLNPDLPKYFVVQSWGNLFGKKLNDLGGAGAFESLKDLLFASLDSLLKAR